MSKRAAIRPTMAATAISFHEQGFKRVYNNASSRGPARINQNSKEIGKRNYHHRYGNIRTCLCESFSSEHNYFSTVDKCIISIKKLTMKIICIVFFLILFTYSYGQPTDQPIKNKSNKIVVYVSDTNNLFNHAIKVLINKGYNIDKAFPEYRTVSTTYKQIDARTQTQTKIFITIVDSLINITGQYDSEMEKAVGKALVGVSQSDITINPIIYMRVFKKPVMEWLELQSVANDFNPVKIKYDVVK